MYVSDYLSHAVKGELKPLNVSDIGDSNPNDQQLNNKNIIISYINLANAKLHEKFGLIQKEYILENISNNSIHAIPTDFLYATSASLEDGTEVPINNDRKIFLDGTDVWMSVLFPSPFQALIKGSNIDGYDKVSILYVGAPKKVSFDNEFIDLSEVYTEALLNYVAYKAYSSVQGDMQATNNTFYLRFVASCNAIKTLGLNNPNNLDTNIKLEERGFV